MSLFVLVKLINLYIYKTVLILARCATVLQKNYLYVVAHLQNIHVVYNSAIEHFTTYSLKTNVELYFGVKYSILGSLQFKYINRDNNMHLTLIS